MRAVLVVFFKYIRLIWKFIERSLWKVYGCGFENLMGGIVNHMICFFLHFSDSSSTNSYFRPLFSSRLSSIVFPFLFPASAICWIHIFSNTPFLLLVVFLASCYLVVVLFASILIFDLSVLISHPYFSMILLRCLKVISNVLGFLGVSIIDVHFVHAVEVTTQVQIGQVVSNDISVFSRA